MPSKPARVTQRTIAELAGVSQATVSLVLNGRTDTTTRISDETRQRVLEVIRETSYMADPAARNLAGKANDLVGIFTYESAFPTESSDFYAPLLTGVEAAAESLGVDLLLFTSARVVDGRRRLLQEGSRLRMADGCVLLGREMDVEELGRLVETGYPFVAVGRRDGDERIPYVGADYGTTVAQLVDLAIERGHRRFAYLRLPFTAESTVDRLAGFSSALEHHGLEAQVTASDAAGPASAWRAIRDSQATVVFVEDPLDADRLADLAEADGIRVPDALSLVALGEPARLGAVERDFTRLVAPRSELGASAVRLLAQIMRTEPGEQLETRVLLPCALVPGETLGRIAS
jgi:DNA-binding LacI/PurR family transcriptional regulator